MAIELYTMFYAVLSILVGARLFFEDDSSVPVDYRTDDPEGEGSMSAVLETSDRHVDSVSVIVVPTTFMFRTISSGKFYRLRSSDKQTNRRGNISRSVC